MVTAEKEPYTPLYSTPPQQACAYSGKEPVNAPVYLLGAWARRPTRTSASIELAPLRVSSATHCCESLLLPHSACAVVHPRQTRCRCTWINSVGIYRVGPRGAGYETTHSLFSSSFVYGTLCPRATVNHRRSRGFLAMVAARWRVPREYCLAFSFSLSEAVYSPPPSSPRATASFR